MITDSEAGLLHDIEALIPEKWLSNVKTPWLEGENSIIEICNRFHFYSKEIIPSFREFFNDPRSVPKEINEKLINGFINIIPISSAEAERGFSKMNLVCTKIQSSMTVSYLSSLMVISINGAPVQLWNVANATSKWLQKHKQADENRTRKCKDISVNDFNKVKSLFC